jgi:hypothetical protein
MAPRYGKRSGKRSPNGTTGSISWSSGLEEADIAAPLRAEVQASLAHAKAELATFTEHIRAMHEEGL